MSLFYDRTSVRFVRFLTSCATAKDIPSDISHIYNGFIVISDNALYATQCDTNTNFARLQQENLLLLSVAMGQQVTTIVGMCFIVNVSSDVVDLPKETGTANKRRSFGL